jgi:gas vesicle protein GvpL/GvpF
VPCVYAVTEARDHAPAPTLYAVRHGALAAVVADHEAPEPTPEALRRHETVVEGLMGDGPLLPMRFGSVTDDVAGLLAAREEELLAALERVRGAVELGVRGTGHMPADGTGYLMRRVAAARAHEPLAALARASVRRSHPHVGAYLVDEAAVDGFTARVRELGEDLVCTGPWPPYSFCDA